jgi:hypothetical protein
MIGTALRSLHFGALGLANGAMTILESAKLSNNDNTIEFVLLGGSRR